MIIFNYINESEMLNAKPVRIIGDIVEKLGWLKNFKEKHGIIGRKCNSSDSVESIGFSEKEQKWYGWSHRAISGFGIGDKIFEPNFGDDKTPFSKHGSKTIRNIKDAEKSARAFARDVS